MSYFVQKLILKVFGKNDEFMNKSCGNNVLIFTLLVMFTRVGTEVAGFNVFFSADFLLSRR